MKDLMMLFGVTLAKRYTNGQKRIFYSQAIPFFKKLGYTVEFQKVKKNINRVVNIIVGNIEKSKYIILCPYDTPSKALLVYKYFPFNCSENRRQENIELILHSVFYIGLCVSAYFTYNHYSTFSTLLKVISIIDFTFLMIFSYKLISGIPNPVNFNKNSASVALMAALAEKTKKNPSVCYVLLDKNVSSNAGLKALAQDNRMKNKFFIYLDCLSSGEMLTCVHGYSTSLEAKRLIDSLSDLEMIDRFFEDDRLKDTNLQIFPKMLHICVGKVEDGKFVVQNTRSKKDYRVDISRLEKLQSGLLKFVKG